MDGMGEENQQEFAAVEAGPSRLEPFLTGFAAELGAATAVDVESAFGDLLGAADRAALTGEYAEHMALCARDALAGGIWGWFDDDVAFFADWGFDLASIDVPVHVWQGIDDRFVPPAHGEWLAEHVAGARGHMLPEEGHLSLRVTRFGDVLDALLASGR
jgi:pimeloyl-ACP methyl ester carboxylesterase